MNDRDIRVVKTIESIENALFTLLHEKPLSKITVTELARTARINKGTFYLHYLDINDLYTRTMVKTLCEPIETASFFTDFFDDPEQFMLKLDLSFADKRDHLHTLLQGQSELLLFDRLLGKLSEKIYETGRIPKNIENDMKLDAVFSALLGAMPKYYEDHRQEADALAASLIRFFFPQ